MRVGEWWLWVAVAALAAAVWAARSVRSEAAARARGEEAVRRLLALERSLGPTHPDVRRLCARVRPYLLGEPDPIPWGRYQWRAGGRPSGARLVDAERHEA